MLQSITLSGDPSNATEDRYEELPHPHHDGALLFERWRRDGSVRRVGGGGKNIPGRYPSQKMGCTVQFESHTVELAFIYEYEHDPNVIRFCDQPAVLKLTYKNSKGKSIGRLHVPDFLVDRGTFAFEECKTESELVRISEACPSLFTRSPAGGWRCPPGEQAASRLGCQYRVRSSSTIDWVFQANICFLEDYFRADRRLVTEVVRQRVLALLCAHPGQSLDTLFAHSIAFATRDDVYQLIADGFVHVNLAAAFLRSPSLVRVFATSEEAANATSKTSSVVPITAPAPHVSLSVGTCLTWRTVLWKIVNVSPTTVSLLSQQNELTELPFPGLETLIYQGHIQPIAVSADQTSSPGLELLLSADERDLKEANRRAYLLGRDAHGTDQDGRVAVPARTRDRWAARFRTASNVHGVGYLGLLPHTRDRGNRSPRMSEASRTLMAEFVQQD